MEVAGWFATILIGVSLGLIGGGGSILTVPVLVYLFGTKPSLATAYSLFVVGCTALIGSATYLRRREINLRAATGFVVPSVTAVFLTRRILLPSVPEHIAGWLTKDRAVLLLFAGLMLLASFKMIRGIGAQKVETKDPSLVKIGGLGLAVGLLAGLVGAGGGFLIVPALVLFAGLDMKTAIGTSLFIIGAQSLIGFTGDLGAESVIDWPFLLKVTALAAAGIFLGSAIGRKVTGAQLRPAFGWFVLAMAVLVLTKELFF